MKKLFSIITIISLFCALTMSSFAFEKESIDAKYGLKTVKSVPKGITPIKIDSEEELENFINSISDVEELEVTEEDISIRTGRGSDYVTKRVSKKDKAIMFQYELYGKVKIYSKGSFRSIEEVSGLGMSITGYTLGIELRDSSVRTDYDIAPDKQSVKITGEADVDYYILINDIFKLCTTHKKMNLKYSI